MIKTSQRDGPDLCTSAHLSLSLFLLQSGPSLPCSSACPRTRFSHASSSWTGCQGETGPRRFVISHCSYANCPMETGSHTHPPLATTVPPMWWTGEDFVSPPSFGVSLSLLFFSFPLHTFTQFCVYPEIQLEFHLRRFYRPYFINIFFMFLSQYLALPG